MEAFMEFTVKNSPMVKVSKNSGDSKKGVGANLVVSGYSAVLSPKQVEDLIRALTLLQSDALEEVVSPTPKFGKIPLAIPGQPDPSHDAHSAWDDK